MKLKRIRLLLIIAILTFTIISFGLSAQNGSSSTSLTERIMMWLNLVSWPNIRNRTTEYYVWLNVLRQGAHFSLYIVGTVPVFLLVYTYQRNLLKVSAITVLVIGLYALSDEIHQLFVVGRSFQVIDLLTDLSGIILSCAILMAMTWITHGIERGR